MPGHGLCILFLEPSLSQAPDPAVCFSFSEHRPALALLLWIFALLPLAGGALIITPEIDDDGE